MSVEAADAATSPAGAAAEATSVSPQNLTVIYLLLVSAFVVILNETIMAVALPHLMADLNATANAFVVESMQLAYQRFSLDKG